jgi:phosphate transport system protein
MYHRQQFDASLQQLHEALVKMGKDVEDSIRQSVQALVDGNVALAEQVIENDKQINEDEEHIVELGTNLIALQQPVAKDLRRILVAFRMASDFERMGDLAVDIARVVQRINGEPLIKPLVDIPRMSEIVQQMTKDSIQAYVDENVDLAYQMAKMDDEVDRLHSNILQEMFQMMVQDPQVINQAQLISFVSRYLERMADHATNIGENVVYLVKGKRPDLN